MIYHDATELEAKPAKHLPQANLPWISGDVITRCNDWLPKHQVGDMRSTLVGCVDLGSSEEDSTPGRFRFKTSVLKSALRA